LHYSVSNCTISKHQINISKLLIKENPSLLHQVNSTHLSPLCIACMRDHPEMVKLLLVCKADPNEISHDKTILMNAVIYSSLDVVVLLLQHGAKANTKIKNKTASDWWIYDYHDYKKRYVLEAEKIAGCSKETLLDITTTLSVIDVPMFRLISPFDVHDLIYEINVDEVACYVAIHEGEEVTLTKYRKGEMVCFSQAPIRCIGRSFGTRSIRKLLTSYLVHKHRFIHNPYTI
jgi:hypothetical protein